MRIYVPRALYVIGSRIMTEPFYDQPNPSQHHTERYCMALCNPDDLVAIEVPSYFYETHGREINDCVHAKLVGEGKMPNLDVGNRVFYRDIISSHSGLSWTLDPLRLDGNPLIDHISGSLSERIINDGAFSMWMQFNHRPCGRKQRSYFSMTAYARAKINGVYKNFKLERQLIIGFDGIKGERAPNGQYPVVITPNDFEPGRFNGKLPKGYEVDPSFIPAVKSLCCGIDHSAGWSSWYWTMPGRQDLIDHVFKLLEKEIRRWFRWGLDHDFQGWSTISLSRTDVFNYEVHPDAFFVFQEPDIVVSGVSPQALSNKGLPQYWRNVLVQRAYLDAVDHMPRLNDNSISNILEIAGFIKSLVIDHKIEIPSSLGSLWLSYRYAYQTTKLDAEEAISFVARYNQLGSFDKWITCYGQSQHDYVLGEETIPVICKCCFHIRPREVAMLAKIWRALYTYGLQPNFYVIWDSIPYSFIVDWLIPVGSLAHVADARNNINSTNYEITDVCFSMKYERYDEYRNQYQLYSRWSQDVPELSGFYFLEIEPSSQKVVGMRILDTLSLTIGKG